MWTACSRHSLRCSRRPWLSACAREPSGETCPECGRKARFDEVEITKSYGVFFDNTYRSYFDMGATDPVQASAGTIRGDHALDVQQNIVHGSDSPDSAEREIKIFFPDLV